MDKHSSLLRKFVNYDCKKFNNIDTGMSKPVTVVGDEHALALAPLLPAPETVWQQKQIKTLRMKLNFAFLQHIKMIPRQNMIGYRVVLRKVGHLAHGHW